MLKKSFSCSYRRLNKKYSRASALLCALLLLPIAAQATSIELPQLHIQAKGEVTAEPDMAMVSIAVNITEKTAQAAKKASDEAISLLLTRLENMHVARADIQTANLQLQPKYQYGPESEPKVIGYQALRDVLLTVRDLSQLNSILDGALTDGLNLVNNIRLTSSKQAELKQQATLAAIENAKQQAALIATGFNLQVDSVWQISYQPASTRPPELLRMATSAGIDTSYQDSQITVQDSLEVTFKLRPKP